MAALYGAAMGARYGVGSALAHAAGVPLAFLAIASFAAPAFYIVLWHCGAEIDAGRLAAATAEGLHDAGRALAGLAPAVLLFGATLETAVAAAFLSAGGLAIALVLGLRTLSGAVQASLAEGCRGRGALASWPFCALALLLAARVWWAALPALGGAS
jgi:hypothetical protein